MLEIANVNVSDLIGAEIVYDDYGVWGYYPRSQRRAVVVGVVASRVYDFCLIIKADGINLEKRITPQQVISYVWASEKASA